MRRQRKDLTKGTPLLAISVLATAIGAGTNDWASAAGSAPPATETPAQSGAVRKAKGAAQEHGLHLRFDAALYDQRASDVLMGSRNLGTVTWQLAGHWRLLDDGGWGTGSVGWSFLGSQSIGAGATDETLSGNVGSISGLNANVVPNVAAVDELFWRHEAADRRWALLVGRVDQASHFDANRIANDGYSQFFAFAFENNLSIPWSTYGGFGGVLRVDLGGGRYVLASVAAVNNEPRVPWSAAGHEGWNQMLEIGTTHTLPGLGRGHVRVTPWHNSIPGADGFGVAINLDQQLGSGPTCNGPGPSSGQWIGFFRAGVGDPAVTPVRAFASAGVALQGPFGRTQDRMAIGIAWSDASPGAGARDETLIEAYYRFALSPALSLTPDLQLVVDPALDPDAQDTVVLGLRLHLTL
jgi:porin